MREFTEHTDPRFWASPQTTFADLFRSGERCLHAPGGGLCVFGHNELVSLGRMPAIDGVIIGDTTPAMAAGPRALFREALFAKTGAPHRALRKAALAGLCVDAIAARQFKITAIVDQHLSAIPNGRSFDLAQDLALPVTTRVWADLVGFPASTLPELSAHVALLSTPAPSADEAEIDRAAFRLIEMTQEIWTDAPSPFMQSIADAMPGDGSGDPTRLVASMIIDGIDSAASGLACALLVMAEHAHLWTPTSAGREKALQEGLRLGMPVILSMRQATADIAFSGLSIAKGTILWMWWGAGCVDPMAYDDPLTFRADRAGPTAPVFGTGRHACLGHALFRAVAHPVITACFAADRNLDVDTGELRWEEGRLSRQPQVQARFAPSGP